VSAGPGITAEATEVSCMVVVVLDESGDELVVASHEQ
jgi:hypothetical protein